MSGELIDDGTLDTVISCTECGEEARYNFDPAPISTAEQTEKEREESYDEFVKGCIEDFENDHTCREPETR